MRYISSNTFSSRDFYYYLRLAVILFILIAVNPALTAQRRGPVPVPQGGSSIFPDWVFFILVGGIALFIVFALFGWLVSCFRDFKSFTELLGFLFLIGGTWFFLEVAHWNFWWSLLAGFASAMLLVSAIEYVYKQIKTK